MTMNDFFASSMKTSLDMLKMTVADLTDADLMTRPVPAANHLNWQIGHVIASEVGILSAAGAKMPELPAGFTDRYNKATSTSDDASKFAKKEELLGLFDKVRAASIAWVKTLTPAQFAAKGPMEFLPTVADAANITSGHVFMHMGQAQVLRRKLGKPILF